MAAQNGDVRCNLRISRHGVYEDLMTASTPAEGDGTIFEWFRPFNHERITNEACSLELISRETTIPVPRLVDYGVHEDGREFLFTERVKAVLLSGVEAPWKGKKTWPGTPLQDDEICFPKRDGAEEEEIVQVITTFYPEEYFECYDK
ncbi:uncharacterized protein L3040_002870 [Drepanopeziza brunnea f. sp. 'multigermtubi']|uniref:uncharacterized protein n=1 Tax=Drepanopeziza brunnea f. sp. 'multigermtubi' TaxID=698441 RepID=UPI00238E9FE7|nr:hypothetical protein L3040_002870 [Drepanopeziza brunnea f. sp. 'multigermtubi']